MEYNAAQLARLPANAGTRFAWFELVDAFSKEDGDDTDKEQEKTPYAKAIRLTFKDGVYKLPDDEQESTIYQAASDSEGTRYHYGATGDRVLCYMNVDPQRDGMRPRWEVLFWGMPKTFRIKNATGKDLEAFQVVGLDGPINTPGSYKRRPAYFDDYDTDSTRRVDLFQEDAGDMIGVKPTASHFGRFAVVTSAIKKNAIGPACVCGVTICKVTFSGGVQQEFADINQDKPTVESLLGCPMGAAQVLWAGSTWSWSVIRLGPKVQQGFRGTLLEKLEMGKKAKCRLEKNLFQVDVYDHMLTRGESMPKDTKVWIAIEDGKFYVVDGSCPSEFEDEE